MDDNKRDSREVLSQIRGGPGARRMFVCARAGHGVLDQTIQLDCRTEEALDAMIENCVGGFPYPLGVAQHFVINGVERLVPMATEERSVIAAASCAAKLSKPTGGFTAEAGRSVMAGQILFSGFRDESEVNKAYVALHHRHNPHSLPRIRDRIAKQLESDDRHGRRLIDAEIGIFGGERPGVVVSLWFDTGETMGANFTTAMAEQAASLLGKGNGLRATACICSNGSGRQTKATARWPGLSMTTMERILDLQAWAKHSSSRAVTDTKGVLNGIEAVCLATGQDTRAVTAAVISGGYCDNGPSGGPLARFRIENRELVGEIVLALPVATAGGATQHPTAIACRDILQVASAKELAETVACVGLAQNFAALSCLVEEGLTEAHRRLRNKR